MSMKSFESIKADVAEKVRKLLAQAEDPAATPEEAHAFTMKAQQLMSKYSIELAMISDAVAAHDLVERGWAIDNPYASHKVALVNAIARANDCRAIYASLNGGRKYIHVVGHATDVEWVETLYRSLDIQLAVALQAAARTRPSSVHGRTYAVGFIQGFVAEINARLHAARQAAVRDAEEAASRETSGAGSRDGDVESATGRSVALVLVAKAQRVDDEFRVRHPHTRTVYTQTRLRSWSGYDPGREAGRRANLARGAVDGARGSLTA
jgi:hypothetical protein